MRLKSQTTIYSVSQKKCGKYAYRRHKKNKKSFVIVISDFDFNAISDKLIVVPSLLEAHDIIEMEEIERDLGF